MSTTEAKSCSAVSAAFFSGGHRSGLLFSSDVLQNQSSDLQDQNHETLALTTQP